MVGDCFSTRFEDADNFPRQGVQQQSVGSPAFAGGLDDKIPSEHEHNRRRKTKIHDEKEIAYPFLDQLPVACKEIVKDDGDDNIHEVQEELNHGLSEGKENQRTYRTAKRPGQHKA